MIGKRCCLLAKNLKQRMVVNNMGTKVAEKKNEIQTQMIDMTDKAKELTITNQESFDISGQFLIDLASMKKKMIAYHKDAKETTKKAKDVAYQKEKDDLAPIASADSIVRVLRGDYKRKEDAKIKKEQDRLDKLAQDKANRETAKILKKAEKEEDPEKKEELEQQSKDVYVPPNIAAGTMQKTTKQEGGGSTTWITETAVEITDEMELLKEIVAGKAPITLIKFNNLKPWVKSVGIKNGQIKGIRITETQRESIRSR